MPQETLSSRSHALLFPGPSYKVAIQARLFSERVCETVNVTVSPSDFTISTGSKIKESAPIMGCKTTSQSSAGLAVGTANVFGGVVSGRLSLGLEGLAVDLEG